MHFTARSYASAVLAIVVCLSVSLSVTSLYFTETTGGIELGFGKDTSFHISYIESPKIRVGLLPSGNLPQTLDLENFATAS